MSTVTASPELSSRREFYRMTAEEVAAENQKVWDELRINGVAIPPKRIDWTDWVEILGLKLAPSIFVPELDSDGEPALDDKGEAKGHYVKPRYRFKSVCKVEGLEDCEGTPIPQGQTVYFQMVNQEGNRKLTESNWVKLKRPIVENKWANNVDPIRIRRDGQGASTQHRGAAYCDSVLRGEIPPTHTMDVLIAEGCSPKFDPTVDAVKKLTGSDMFSQELRGRIDDSYLITHAARSRGGDIEPGDYHPDMQQAVETISANAHSPGKYILYRMAGKQHTYSPPQACNMEELAENALHLCVEVFPDFVELAAMTYSYNDAIPFKDRFTNESQLLAAGTLYLAERAECPPIDTLALFAKESLHPGVDLMEAEPISLDVDRYAQLLDDLAAANIGHGPFADFVAKRKELKKNKHSANSQYAQLVLAIKQWDRGEEVDASICLADITGPKKVTSKKFPHFGGPDIGPLAKPTKEGDDE